MKGAQKCEDRAVEKNGRALEAAIPDADTTVYDLYGLTGEEITVVETFA